MQKTMKRWALSALGRDNLTLDDAPLPVPQRGEVLVRTKAVSLNYRDKLVMETGMGMTLDFPFVPASDMTGVVEAVGGVSPASQSATG